MAKYFANTAGTMGLCCSEMLVDFAGQASRTRKEREREREGNRRRETVQVAPIEATACGIVPGLRGLELQTNAITPHPMPPYTGRIVSPRRTRIHRSAIEPPISVSPTRFHSTGASPFSCSQRFLPGKFAVSGFSLDTFRHFHPDAAQFRKYVTNTYMCVSPFLSVW